MSYTASLVAALGVTTVLVGGVAVSVPALEEEARVQVMQQDLANAQQDLLLNRFTAAPLTAARAQAELADLELSPGTMLTTVDSPAGVLLHAHHPDVARTVEAIVY
ncbi:hypothetical protein [Sinomonas halotolerans]|uniref:Uncharacterized protein n=1 Tax=Sinomonas halotolerans TaxID=1644133 RepID=A0ABU9WW08_9MICC